LQAKECQRLPKDHQKLEEKQGPDSFSQSWHPDFVLQVSRLVRQYISIFELPSL
jgi:hypothetical protein